MKSKKFSNILKIAFSFSIFISTASIKHVCASQQLKSPYLICKSVKQLKKNSTNNFLEIYTNINYSTNSLKISFYSNASHDFVIEEDENIFVIMKDKFNKKIITKAFLEKSDTTQGKKFEVNIDA